MKLSHEAKSFHVERAYTGVWELTYTVPGMLGAGWTIILRRGAYSSRYTMITYRLPSPGISIINPQLVPTAIGCVEKAPQRCFARKVARVGGDDAVADLFLCLLGEVYH